jgi:ankyrin repeat protein
MAVILVSLPGVRLHADGCFVSGKFADLHAPQQKVAITWDGQREAMVLSTRVRAADLDNFGWIIPIKTDSKPEVELADSEIFDHLKDYFATLPKAWYANTLSLGSPGGSVEVVETKDVGIYKVTIVKATDSDALVHWLSTNDFKTNDALADTLASYRVADFFFVLAKIDLRLELREEIEFISRQSFLADVASLDGKAIKALAALRWPRGGESLAALTAADILSGKAYANSHLASNPLHREYRLLTRAEYESLADKHRGLLGEETKELAETLSSRFFANESVQNFVKVEDMFRDLEAGVANPLKISFVPAKPFFPMKISRVNEGKVAVVAYVFADEPLKDESGILEAKVWKPVGDDIRAKVATDLDVTDRTCLTKLTFSGRSTAFVKDVYFAPMARSERGRLLEERQIVAPRLHAAIDSHDVNTIRDLLHEHPNMNAMFENASILSMSIVGGRFSFRRADNEGASARVLHLLLRHGFDVNAQDEAGRTVLQNLAKEGVSRSTMSPPQTATSRANKSGLSQAAAGSSHSVSGPPLVDLAATTKLLLDAGATVNITDNEGMTALHLLAGSRGARYELAEVTKLLLEAGARVNLKDNGGKTPLHHLASARVAYAQLQDAIKLLLDAGAQVNLADNEGRTPLDCLLASARRYSNPATGDAAALLIRHGATVGDSNIGDLEGMKRDTSAVALAAAIEVGNEDLISFLTKGRGVWNVDMVCHEASKCLLRVNQEASAYKAMFCELVVARHFAPSDSRVLSLLGIAQYRLGDPNALGTLRRARVLRQSASRKGPSNTKASPGEGRREPYLAGRVAQFADSLEWQLSSQHVIPREPVVTSALPLVTAAAASPPHEALDTPQLLTLSWCAGEDAMQHDVYLGDDTQAVADADTTSPDVYKGRQSSTSILSGALAWGKTYYWRVDEVQADGTILKGAVWRFTTASCILVDTFEGYCSDVGRRVFEVWLDGTGFSQPEPGNPGNGTGMAVGYDIWSPDSPYYNGKLMETANVAQGDQAMPLNYDNTAAPFFSEAKRSWAVPQDWTAEGVDTLSLWFKGKADNAAEPIYLRIADSLGNVATIVNSEPDAAKKANWTQWTVTLSAASDAGVDLTAIRSMAIGAGNPDAPTAGGAGLLLVDDIRIKQAAAVK